MATDRIDLGKSLVITPGEFGSFVHDVNAAVIQLLHDAITQEMPEELIEAYSKWMTDVWSPFFQENENWFEEITGSAFASTLERADALRAEYAAFRTQFEAAGLVGNAPAPQAADQGSNWKPLLWGGLVVVGLFGIGYALSKVPQVSSAKEEV